MSILVNQDTRLLVQAITGRAGEFHCTRMLGVGTNVVAGVTPAKGGQYACEGQVPVYDSVQQAVAETGANVSAVFVPARWAADAVVEAADAGIPLVVCITEHIPVHDMLRVVAYLEKTGTRLVGPNCPGILSPGQANVGIIPEQIAIPGPVGVVSRSGTLTYEVVSALSARGIGQSTCVGIGGDPIVGTTFSEILELFERDPATEQIVLIGEIGGSSEEQAAEAIAARARARGRGNGKPVVAFVAGRTAPPGKRMGHAGAIIEGSSGTAEAKVAAFEAISVPVAEHPGQIADLLKIG